MKFNINTKVDINFSEEQIKEALAEIIKQEQPEIMIEDITLVIKRNPSNISAQVTAGMKGSMKENAVTTETEPEEGIVERGEETSTEKVSDFLDLG